MPMLEQQQECSELGEIPERQDSITSVDSEGSGQREEIVRDKYGFPIRSAYVDMHKQYEGVYAAEEESRVGRWKKTLHSLEDAASENSSVDKNWDKLDDIQRYTKIVERIYLKGTSSAKWRWNSHSNEVVQLDELVRQGIPMAWRQHLWKLFATDRANKRQKGVYDELLERLRIEITDWEGSSPLEGNFGPQENDNTSNGAMPPRENGYMAGKEFVEETPRRRTRSQIEKDLARSLPGHPSLEGPINQQPLRRLLNAYAMFNPKVGYCQGMNFLAAVLLLFLNEEDAFWALSRIVDDLFEGYYSDPMEEAQVDQMILEYLVKRHLPDVKAHCEEYGVDLKCVTAQWFLCLFINALPWEGVLRVWDLVFYYGNRAWLFSIALAVVETQREKIVTIKDTGDTLQHLQNSVMRLFDISGLIESAYASFKHTSTESFNGYRSRFKKEVRKQQAIRRQMRSQIFASTAASTSKTAFGRLFQDYSGPNTPRESSCAASTSEDEKLKTASDQSNENDLDTTSLSKIVNALINQNYDLQCQLDALRDSLHAKNEMVISLEHRVTSLEKELEFRSRKELTNGHLVYKSKDGSFAHENNRSTEHSPEEHPPPDHQAKKSP